VKVFYGICGEGLGHAGRSIAVIERLTRLGHNVTTFTFGSALQLLQSSGYGSYEIDGLRFRMKSNGAISAYGTLHNLVEHLATRRDSLDLIRQLAFVIRPDLFVTDFEPLTAIVAASLGIPCASIDNQHKFCAPMEQEFPLALRLYGRVAGAFVRRWIWQPRLCIVAVFHRCPPSPQYHRVGVLVRDRMARLRPSPGAHVLLYGYGEIGKRLVDVAKSIPEQFVAYGCKGDVADNIQFKPTSYHEFAADLASCKAVISTAGQQLIGEASFFGKPIFVVPIPNQHEQLINARYVRKEKIGDYSPVSQLSVNRIQDFLRQPFSQHAACNGLDQTLELLGTCYG